MATDEMYIPDQGWTIYPFIAWSADEAGFANGALKAPRLVALGATVENQGEWVYMMPLPNVGTAALVECAVRLAARVTKAAEFAAWAEAWLSDQDRSDRAANRAVSIGRAWKERISEVAAEAALHLADQETEFVSWAYAEWRLYGDAAAAWSAAMVIFLNGEGSAIRKLCDDAAVAINAAAGS